MINNDKVDGVSDLQQKESFPVLASGFVLPIQVSAYLHALQASPQFIHFKAFVIQVFEPFVWLVQTVFYSIIDCFLERYSLFYTEWASWNHMGACITEFNQSKDHGALFLNPFFGMLDQNGQDWNQPYKNAASVFSRMIDDLSNQYFAKKNLKEQGVLRKELETKNKPMLAMLINHHHHWTVIHINFRNNTIAYVDSLGISIDDKKTKELIQQRLNQTKQWIEQLDNQKWTLKDNGTTLLALKNRQQHDWWNCGPCVMELTHLVANDKKSYEEIDQIPFAEMQGKVHKRRYLMMEASAKMVF